MARNSVSVVVVLLIALLSVGCPEPTPPTVTSTAAALRESAQAFADKTFELSIRLQTLDDTDPSLVRSQILLARLGAAAESVSLATGGLDLTDLDILDSIVYIMMLLAKDAQDDMREMLIEMGKARSRREALRQSNEEIDSAMDEAREAYAQVVESAQNMLAVGVVSASLQLGSTPLGTSTTGSAFVDIADWFLRTGTGITLTESAGWITAGGIVSATADCGAEVATSRLSLRIEDIFEDTTLALGTGSLSTTVRHHAPVLVRLTVAPSTTTTLESLQCTLDVRTTGRQLFAPSTAIDPGKRRLAIEDGLNLQGQMGSFEQYRASTELNPAFSTALHDVSFTLARGGLSAWHMASLADLTQLSSAKAKELDAVQELSDGMARRLQDYMDRRSEVLDTLRQLMRLISETQSQIISNLK